ncbi:hypothetical protein FGB62_15g10 [Gracilaria domingensis]|nr:hypothetical protein FGB62_15g10 [Gracilaria domingensis]
MEDLQLRRPQCMEYEGETFAASLSRGCVPLIQSETPIVIKPFVLCLRESRFHTDIPDMHKGILILPVLNLEEGNLGLVAHSSNESRYQFLEIKVTSTEGSRTHLNVTKLVNHPLTLVKWMINRISYEKDCSAVTVVDETDLYATATGCKGTYIELLEAAKGIFLSTLSLSDKFLSSEDFLRRLSPPSCDSPSCSEKKTKAASRSDLDQFAAMESVLIRGYVLWMFATGFILVSCIVGAIAPDIELTRSVAAAEYLNLKCVPLHTPSHVRIS